MRRILWALVLTVAVLATGCAVSQETSSSQVDLPVVAASEPAAEKGRKGTKAAPEKPAPAPAPENPAPDFEVATFSGDTFALAEQRGTPVVLNFWESW